MAHQLFQLPRPIAISSSLTLISGAKVGFFSTGTTTPVNVYQDSALTTPHANPVVADSAGRLPAIYLNPSVVYRITFTDANNVEVYPTVDPANDQVLSQAVIGGYLYPRTSAEIAVGAMPVNKEYAPINPRRYGELSPADSAIATADLVAQQHNEAIHFSVGTYLISSDLTIKSNIVVAAGAILRVADGVTLSLLGQVTAPAQKIYELVGSGTVRFGSAANQWPYVTTIVHPEHWGARGINGPTTGNNPPNDTAAVQASFDSHRPVVFLQHYPVTQVILRGNELFIDFNGFELIGIAASGTKSVLDIKCGHSVLHNVQVSAQFNPLYECAIHWYTNDLNIYYPGHNRIFGMWARNALTGLCVGALPSQGNWIPGQGTVQAEGVATDAPLSESSVVGYRSIQCVRGMLYNQPNGKLDFHGSHFIGEHVEWHGGYGGSGYTNAHTCALTIANDGSELYLSGGFIEQITESTGTLMQITGGGLTMSGTTLETSAPTFISGNSRVTLSKVLNFGLNTTQPPFQIDDEALGWLRISDTRVVLQAGNLTAGTTPLFKAVAAIGGGFSPNYGGFIVDLCNVELRDVAQISDTSSYVPIAQGLDIRALNAELTGYNRFSSRVALFRFSFGDAVNLLAGVVDTSNYTVTRYGANGDATSGGWTFTVAGTSSWGSTASGISYEGRTLDTALRLTAAGGGGTITATSPKFAINPQRTYWLRGFIKTATAANMIVRAKFYRYGNTAASIANIDFISGSAGMFGTSSQQLLAKFVAPKDATWMELVLYAENSADVYFTDLVLS